MDAGLSPARQARAQHRYELRTLTYATLDQANGGIVRNLSQNGIGLQVVAAVRPRQPLRVRFELRYPRLQVETRAEVVWATFSGQCGIRFLDISPGLKRQINQWIFGDLLESISVHSEHSESIFAPKNGGSGHPPGNGHVPTSAGVEESEEEDGLLISSMPVKVIELPMRREPPEPPRNEQTSVAAPVRPAADLDWLSTPLSGRALAWTVDVLIVIASLLLFVLVFLSVTRETPRWPLGSVTAAGVTMAALYWGFFRVFAGASLGERLARIAETDAGNENNQARFR